MEAETCETLKLKGVDYSVCIQVSEGSLSVDVELFSTLEQWHNTFDRNDVEELTRKTDNFKQFSVFCSMLEAALKRTKDSVSLDFLTTADLEDLRLKRTAEVRFKTTEVRVLAPQNVAQSKDSQKRYLTLIYKTQFDSVHYPLPLAYIGRPDPRRMQQEIRILKNEVRRARAKTTALTSDASLIGDGMPQESHTARLEVNRLRDEKAALERELNELQLRKLHSGFRVSATSSSLTAGDSELSSTPGNSEQRQRCSVEFTRLLLAKNEDLRREIGLLKGVVQNVEAERVREKSEFQKTLGKRQREFRELKEQLEVLRASDRSLRIKVTHTANELEVCKRLYRAGTSPGVPLDLLRDRNNAEHRANSGGYQPHSRSVSAERTSLKQPKRPESARDSRKRDRLERSLLKSLPKSAREFFGDGQAAMSNEAPLLSGVAKSHLPSNSASSTARGVVTSATKCAASLALVAPKASLPGSHCITQKSSLERMSLVGKPMQPVLCLSKRNEASLQPANSNESLANTKMVEPKRTFRSNDNKLYHSSYDRADRDLVEIDARLQRIQDMMKDYGLPAHL